MFGADTLLPMASVLLWCQYRTDPAWEIKVFCEPLDKRVHHQDEWVSRILGARWGRTYVTQERGRTRNGHLPHRAWVPEWKFT